MNKLNKTKIVCTIGPASWKEATVKAMHKAGMNVARINGAFADNAELERVEKLMRGTSPDIALMLDIKGHEVRLNKFKEPIYVKKGDEFIIGSKLTDPVYPATYPNLYKDLKPGQEIKVDKGDAALKVIKITKSGNIHTKVLFGDKIAPGKGMNFPGAELSNAALTARDREQIAYVAKAGWEFVSASFIRNAEDVNSVRKTLANSKTKLIAKIEDQQGVANIDEIIAGSDGIMIARGDLGSELPLEKLPMIQKQFIYKCNHAAKPVILATNLLESMTVNYFPTRAEVTDVANGVLEGTDSLMTSGETAQGLHPVESVEMLSKIAGETEQYLHPTLFRSGELGHEYIDFPDEQIFETTMNSKTDKILILTEDGKEARILARMNLPQFIYAFVSEDIYKNQLNLTRGVIPFVYKTATKSATVTARELIKFTHRNKLVNKSDTVLIIAKVTDSENESGFISERVKANDYLN